MAPSGLYSAAMHADTEWFARRRWGVFCHYLGAAPSTAGGAQLSAAAWNAQVDAFDVPGLVSQLVHVGAPCFWLMVGQNSGRTPPRTRASVKTPMNFCPSLLP